MKTNLAASVRARLMNISREGREPFDRVANRYAIERLLYRLGESAHARRFVLKGAMLFTFWHDAPHRPTRDVDFLGFGPPETEALVAAFRDLCAHPVADDGLVFDAASVTAAPIRETNDYGGIRVKLVAHLGSARIPIQADVGFGDAVTPSPEDILFPVIFGEFAAPRLRAYPVFTVMAEKLEAMVRLGEANTRLKDFYDLLWLARAHAGDDEKVRAAVSATFARRGPPALSAAPEAFSRDFAQAKESAWKTFAVRNSLEGLPSFASVTEELRTRLAFLWSE
jgi:hypothetical protein